MQTLPSSRSCLESLFRGTGTSPLHSFRSKRKTSIERILAQPQQFFRTEIATGASVQPHSADQASRIRTTIIRPITPRTLQCNSQSPITSHTCRTEVCLKTSHPPRKIGGDVFGLITINPAMAIEPKHPINRNLVKKYETKKQKKNVTTTSHLPKPMKIYRNELVTKTKTFSKKT